MASHENVIAIRHLTATSVEKPANLASLLSVSKLQTHPQLVKILRLAAYSVYDMGVWTGVTYLVNIPSLHSIIFPRFPVLHNQYIHFLSSGCLIFFYQAPELIPCLLAKKKEKMKCNSNGQKSEGVHWEFKWHMQL